jgi:hypothetical protein
MKDETTGGGGTNQQQQQPAAEETPRHFYVCSTRAANRDGSHDTVLFERDAAHPDGEAYVAGPTPVPVGDTGEVSRLLREGVLRKCDAPAPQKQQAAATNRAAK